MKSYGESKMRFQGKVHKYGVNINTDEIIPARFLNTSDAVELAKHCLEGLDEEFIHRVSTGDIIVAGKNFGCGSSREHAPLAIKECGISCVIAETFARIFYRNAINIGLPIVESEQAVKDAQTGDEILVDLEKGTIKNLTKKSLYKIQPFPSFMQELMKVGGLIEYVKKKTE